jgi:hypothetical protein
MSAEFTIFMLASGDSFPRHHIELGRFDTPPVGYPLATPIVVSGSVLFTEPWASLRLYDVTALDKSKFTVKTVAPTPILEELAGAQLVQSETLISVCSDATNAFDGTTHGMFPREVTELAPEYNVYNQGVYVSRPTYYRVHFTEGSERRPYETSFNEGLYLLGATRRLAAVPVEELTLPLHPKGPDMLADAYGALVCLWLGDTSKKARDAVDSILAPQRTMGARLLRNLPQWDAERFTHYAGLYGNLQQAAIGQSYMRVMFNLWSMYFQALISENRADLQGANVPNTFFDFLPVNAAAAPAIPQADVTYLGTRIIQTKGNANWVPLGAAPNQQPPILDPEDGYSNIGATGPNDVANGRAVFIDAVGLSHPALLELIRAFMPTDANHRPVYSGHGVRARYAHPLSYYNIDGSTKFFIHWGDMPEADILPHRDLRGDPAGIDPLPNMTPWPAYVDRHPQRKTPSSVHIREAILHMVVKHHAGGDAANALELVQARMYAFRPQDSPVARANATQHFVSCFGANRLALPPTRSSLAYFDTFFEPMDVPRNIHAVFGSKSAVLLSTAWYMNLHLANSINWPGHTLAMDGERLAYAARPPAGVPPNSNIAIHIHEMVSVKRRDQMSSWSAAHKNAFGHMYGYNLSDLAWITAPRVPGPYWRDQCAPYIVNPYAELWTCRRIPIHMTFPIKNALPLWESNAPKPLPSMLGRATRTRLGRSLPIFEGLEWLSDGGMEFSSRYFLGVPNANGDFRHETAPPLCPTYRYGSWETPYQFNWPTGARAFAPIYMRGAGSNDPFANFTVPGSLRSTNIQTGIPYALGVELQTALTGPNANSISRSWRNLYSGVPNQSMTISVAKPYSFLHEFTPDLDYSAVAIFNQRDDSFYGLGLARNEDVEFFRQARAQTLALAGSGAGRNLFPGYLANHNDVHAPKRAQAPKRPNAYPNRAARTGAFSLNSTKVKMAATPPSPPPLASSAPAQLLAAPVSAPKVATAPSHIEYAPHNPLTASAITMPRSYGTYAHVDAEGKVQVAADPQWKVSYQFGDADPAIAALKQQAAPTKSGFAPPTPGKPSRPTPVAASDALVEFGSTIPRGDDLARLGLVDEHNRLKKNVCWVDGITNATHFINRGELVDSQSRRVERNRASNAGHRPPIETISSPHTIVADPTVGNPATAPSVVLPLASFSGAIGVQNQQPPGATDVVPNDMVAIEAQRQLIALDANDTARQIAEDVVSGRIRVDDVNSGQARGVPPAGLATRLQPKNSS